MKSNAPRKGLLWAIATGTILALVSAPPCSGSDQEDGGLDRTSDGRMISTSDDALVSLSRQRATVRVGDRVLLSVKLSRGRDVGHVPFHLEFDSNVLQFEDSGEGTFLNQDGQATVFLASPNRSGNSVVVGLSRLGGEVGAVGDGELCWLAFRAVGRGDARLTFSHAVLRDANNHDSPVTFRTTTVVVD